jgi:hypothetical protein
MHYSLLSLFDGSEHIRSRRYAMTKEDILEVMQENPYRAKWLAENSPLLTEEERADLIEMADMDIEVLEYCIEYLDAFPDPREDLDNYQD